jgi:hypothetical protein
LYEEEKNTVGDELNSPMPMGYIVNNEEQHDIEILSSYTQYMSKFPKEENNEL